MKLTKKLAAIAACACMAATSMVGMGASASYADGKNTSVNETNNNVCKSILAEDVSNLNYAGTYYSAINDGNIYLEKSPNGTGSYTCNFYNVWLGGTNYYSGNVSCFLNPTVILASSGTKIGTFTFTAGNNDPETCDMYYYNNSYDHNITIFIHGIPYEKAL